MRKFIYFFLIAYSVLYSGIALAASATGYGDAACVADNPENLGDHIINWMLCGASYTQPKSTAFGALSLILNIAGLALIVWMTVINGLKYAFFTAQHGAPGGNKIQGGISVIRNALVVTMLCPWIANGFSPVQVLVRQFTETGAYFGDEGAKGISSFLTHESSLSPPDIHNIQNVVWQVVESETCAQAADIFHAMDKKSGLIDQNKKSVNIRYEVSPDKSEITYNWDYTYPVQPGVASFTSGSSSVQYQNGNTTISSNTDKGTCGTITLSIPEYVRKGKINIDTNGNLSFGNLDEQARVYADILTAQNTALKNLISTIHGEIGELYSDQYELMTVSIEASQSGADANKISSTYDSLAGKAIAKATVVNQLALQISTADEEYFSQILDSSKNAALEISRTDNVVSRDGISWQDQLANQGFATLGAYYYVVAKQNQKIVSAQKHLVNAESMVPLYSHNIDSKELSGMQPNEFYCKLMHTCEMAVLSLINQSDPVKEVKSRLKILKEQYNSIRQNTEFRSSYGAIENQGNTVSDNKEHNSIVKWFIDKLNNFAIYILHNIMDVFVGESGTGDIIINLVYIGSSLVNIGSDLLWVLLAIMALSKLPLGRVTKLATGALGGSSSGDESGGGGIANIFLNIAFFCIALGGFFQYIIPAIPLIKWVLEIQSWAIMMFMAFVYAPLWMMSHAAISDDRFMSEHTTAGYGMLVELLFRPLLMVFSFLAALQIMHVTNLGMKMAMSYLIGMGTEGTIGIWGTLFILIITAFLAYQLITRAFELINTLPDYVLQRVSFGARPLGDTANDKSHAAMQMAIGQSISQWGSRSASSIVKLFSPAAKESKKK